MLASNTKSIFTAYKFWFTIIHYRLSTDLMNRAVTRVLLLFDQPSYMDHNCFSCVLRKLLEHEVPRPSFLGPTEAD